MKKILSLLFTMFVLNMSVMPAFAVSGNNQKEVIETFFVSSLDVNNSDKGHIIQFRTTENYNDIPKGTIFVGHIKSIKHGRWAYRRAKVRIELTEMRLPDGTTYPINGSTKRKVLKGSAIGNVCKGVVSFPAVLVVGLGGSVVMLLECISIVGIVLLVPTGMVVGGLCGKLSNGINCKKDAGDVIKLEYSLR